MSWAAKLDKVVEHVREDGTPVWLEFVIRVIAVTGNQDGWLSFWVPVPAGKADEARELLKRL
jgi:hypothetical protein